LLRFRQEVISKRAFQPPLSKRGWGLSPNFIDVPGQETTANSNPTANSIPFWIAFFQKRIDAFEGGWRGAGGGHVGGTDTQLSEQVLSNGFVDHLFGHLV
jgi:hypothetical protein